MGDRLRRRYLSRERPETIDKEANREPTSPPLSKGEFGVIGNKEDIVPDIGTGEGYLPKSV